MDSKWIKVIGISAALLGAVATVVTSWVDDKKMDGKISEGIENALTNRFNMNEES